MTNTPKPTQFLVTFYDYDACGDVECCGPAKRTEAFYSRRELAQALLDWRNVGKKLSSVNIQTMTIWTHPGRYHV